MRKKSVAILDGRKYQLTNIKDTPFQPTPSDCRYWSRIVSQLIFNGELPAFKNVKVRRMLKYWGWCAGNEDKNGHSYCDLEMNSRFPNFSAFFSVLAHECIHAAEYHKMKTIYHGNFFHSHKHLLKSVCGAALKSAY